MSGPSAFDILDSRRWDAALFTTYSLSLTFFEYHLLPRLRGKGCREIWIVVDMDGYLLSLSERRSTRVGQEYRLVPVLFPGSIFHPKCTYLTGPEGNLLMVGSGNLTLGGYGRNLEVLEVLEPDRDSMAFADFSEFLEALRHREDSHVPDWSWASSFALSAEETSHRGNQDPAQARLMHSVNEPISEQIASMITGRADVREVVVLSPYHDTNGFAVRRLCEITGTPKLAVGVPPQAEQGSAFPFATFRVPGVDVRPVVPSLSEDSNRRLHAKWIELGFGDGTRAVLTGSINTTTPALLGAGNVEVGVVRFLADSEKYTQWKEVPIPVERRDKREKKGGDARAGLYAVLKESGLLEGTLLCTANVVGKWDGHVDRHDGESADFSVEVNNEGRFSAIVRAAFDLHTATGIQIVMVKDGRIARGWLHQEAALKLQRIERLSVSSLFRLIQREETEDDEVALLEYFALAESKHLAAFSPAVRFRGEESAPGSDDQRTEIYVDLSEIEPNADAGPPSLPGGVRDRSAASSLERVFALLRQRLLGADGAGRIPKNGREKRPQSNVDDEDGEKLGQAEYVRTALEKFDNQIQKILERADEDHRRVALVLWLEVHLHIVLRRLNDLESARSFLIRWFWKACESITFREKPGSLEQHVFTSAAILAGLPSDTLTEEGADGGGDILRRIHEGLERFVRADVRPETAQDLLLDAPGIGFAPLFLGTAHNWSLRVLIGNVLVTTTCRQDLIHVLRYAKSGRGYPSDSALLRSRVGKEFISAVKRARGSLSKAYREQDSPDFGCPHCGLRLPTSSAQDLVTMRLAKCGNCGRFVGRTSL